MKGKQRREADRARARRPCPTCGATIRPTKWQRSHEWLCVLEHRVMSRFA